ncbi:MAG: hypothetical protein J2P17_07780 [Mycobacterium sp.]|nr:hypothetical protein [Mycobacterium sp.]
MERRDDRSLRPQVPEIRYDALSQEQQRAYQRIARTRSEGVPGPFVAWLARPDLAEQINDVATTLRTHGTLSQRLYELAVLTVARQWDCNFLWTNHHPVALASGLPAHGVEAIRTGAAPQFEREDERVCYEILDELIETQSLTDESFACGVRTIGYTEFMELTTVFGFYSMAAVVLKTYAVVEPTRSRPLDN